jgi:EmrB/QacA subfamily drug resistance transporter
MDRASTPRPGLTLVAMCIAQGMILLDVTIVNVALPAIQRELGVTPANLEWVINAYSLALATLILVGGALGDRYGRKRVVLIGLVVFTACSVLCALARDDPELIVARALQGIGGAFMAALTLSILVDSFPPERRTSAIGIWAAVAGLGFGVGPVVGGLLIAAFGWSAVFWVNVPIGLVALVVTAVGVRESRDPGARALDPLGALLVAGGLFLLTFALIATNEESWTAPRTVAMLLAAVVLLAGFIAWERRAPSPMVPLGLFGLRRFACANIVFWAAYLALASMFFYVTLYWQNLRGWSALRTGLAWIPLNLPFLVVSLNAGRLGATFGPRLITTVGLLLAAAGMIGLAQLGVASSYQLAWPSYVLNGLGYGLLSPAVSSAAMGDVPRASAGVGSGVLNSARQVGVSVGLAVIGSLGVAATTRAWERALDALPAAVQEEAASLVQRVAGGEGHAVATALGAEALAPAFAAFLAGYRVALWAAGVVLAAAAVVAFAGMSPAAEEGTVPGASWA